MKSGREQILAAVRRHRFASSPLSSMTNDWTRYASLQTQFMEILESVGGNAQIVANVDELTRAVANLTAYQQAMLRGCDQVLNATIDQSILEWNVRLDDVDRPHDLASLDFALLTGEFAVAENAAVWVTDRNCRHRAVYFIAQHLALVVPADRIINNLHEAYDRIVFDDNQFGCFISGPSKTADIEQSLVIGAHGPRSLTVFLVDDYRSCGLCFE